MEPKCVWERKNAEWHVEMFDNKSIRATECIGGSPQSDGEIIVMDLKSAQSLAAIISSIL